MTKYKWTEKPAERIIHDITSKSISLCRKRCERLKWECDSRRNVPLFPPQGWKCWKCGAAVKPIVVLILLTSFTALVRDCSGVKYVMWCVSHFYYHKLLLNFSLELGWWMCFYPLVSFYMEKCVFYPLTPALDFQVRADSPFPISRGFLCIISH